MTSNRERLEKAFTPEKAEWLAKYDDVINEMQNIAEDKVFKYGFRLSLNLIAEPMSER